MTIRVVERERIDVDGSALFHNWMLRHVTVGDLRCSKEVAQSSPASKRSACMHACRQFYPDESG